ncbi:MAG: hypothetical protein ABFS86_11710 [Planctomycetota bacterium]
MSRRSTAILGALALLGVLGGVASATILKELTFEEIENCAREAFVGTVLSVSFVEDDGPRKLIFTEVTFTNLRSLKGKFTSATVKYRFAGGTVGDRTLKVIGVPRFTVGQRCFLFTNAELDRLCPAIGWWQGRFLYRLDKEKTWRVHDSDGRPVYGLSKGRPVLKAPAPKSPGETPKPMTVADFEERMGRVIAAGEERRKRELEAAQDAEKTDPPEEDRPGASTEVTK